MTMSKELYLHETDLISDDGHAIHFAYDEEGDILEVVFDNVKATCALELTEEILLRFNLERGQAAGLTILDFSTLASPTEMGPRSFPLTGLDDLPDDLRHTVVKIITSPPVNQFLKVSYFYLSPAERLPITYVERPPSLAMIA
jgi:hypothetical protein